MFDLRNPNNRNRRFKSDKRHLLWHFTAIILLAAALIANVTRAAPCPMETQMYGGAILDGSDDEYEQYFVVDDDDLTRVTSFSYCKCCINPDTGDHEHFRGFSATIYSPTTGFSTQQFGTMYGSDPDTLCETHDMSQEELMRLTVYADWNDAEGIVWYGSEGTTWVSRANGQISFNDEFMLGRPIGFRVIMGDGGIENQPLLISIFYNSCNCPASTFTAGYQITNMENTAVDGPIVEQVIQYQPDNMQDIYGQDCGSYKISYSPTLPFFEISETASTLDYLGRPYPDVARLTQAPVENIGQHTVTVQVYQDIADVEDGFDSPYRGVIPSLEYDIVLTVHPCDVDDLISSTFQGDITYRIGDPAMTVRSTHSFIDTPNGCGYEQTIVINGNPTFFSYDDASNEFNIDETFSAFRVGTYTTTIQTTIQVPTDYTQTDFTVLTTLQRFKFYVEPCIVASLDLITPIADIYWAVGDATRTEFYEFQQTQDCQYDVTYSVTGAQPFFTLSASMKRITLYQTTDVTLIGAYPVTVTAQISFFTDYTKSTTTVLTNSFAFTIFVEPCVVNSYFDTVRVVEIRQVLFAPNFTDGNYVFEETPACGYPETVVLTNLPSTIVSHNEDTSDFTIVETSNFGDLGEYTVTIESSICVPTDHTQTACNTMSVNYEFKIIVETCLVTDFTATVKVVELRYNVGAPSLTDGTYAFEETPICGYPQTINLTDLPTFVTHNVPASQDFTIPSTTDLSLIGEYTVNISGSVCPPTGGMICTSISDNYDFVVYIEPCLVNTYEATQVVGPITYRVGDPAVTSSTYAFGEDPTICNYPETFFSLANLPAWVTHNTASADFTIAPTSDLTLIGEYIVTVTSEIEVPDDYSKTTFTTMKATYDFSIFVEPCIVTELTMTTITAPVQYIIGSDAVTTSQFSFGQVQDCGYDQTIAVTGLETFMSQTTSEEFTIPKTLDLNLEGTYDVTVRAEIKMPDDYTKLSFTTLSNEFTFQVEMIDPCRGSTIDPVSITDMERNVIQVPQPQTVTDSKDSVSLAFASLDGLTYCGPRVIEITSDPTIHSAFLSLDPVSKVLTLGSNDINDVGSYTIEVRTYLEDYPAVEATTTFTVTINYCVVSDMQQAPVAVQLYNVFSAALDFSATPFTLTPACGYDLDYTVQLKDPSTGVYSPLPAWLSNTSGLDFSVMTNDPANVGIYEISIQGSVPLVFMSPTYSEELIVTLNVENKCLTDIVAPVGFISDENLYYISEDGVLAFVPTWSNSVAGCPVVHGMSRIESGGTERPLNSAELAVITFDASNGQASIQTSDFALDGELWTLKIYKQSTASTSPLSEGYYLFDVEFRDICWDSTLLEAQFAASTFSYTLWESQSMLYTEMVDQSQGAGYCGGSTSVVEYVSGPVLDLSFAEGADLSPYTRVAQPDGLSFALEGTIDQASWLGSHTFQIKSTLGSFDPSTSARGINGLYKTVVSDPMTLVILDACAGSVVNADSGLQIFDMTVPEGFTEISAIYTGPTNSVSVQFGNGYDRCGPYMYSFLGQSSLSSIFKNEIVAVDNSADSLTLTLNSDETGTQLTVDITVSISLQNYPAATPNEQSFQLIYFECFPSSFVGPQFEDQEVTVGDDGFELDFTFDQLPCDYFQEYKIVVFDKDTGEEIEIPDFIDLQGNIVVIDVPQSSDVGVYEIQVCGSIKNSLFTTVCTGFDLKVVPLPGEEPAPEVDIFQVEPDFLINLTDQRVKVGDDLSYSPGAQIGVYGEVMEVQVQLLDSFRFMTYDEATNSFNIDGSLVAEEDVGEYPVKIRATFYNETFSESYTRTFTLTVWSDNIAPKEVVFEEELWMPPDPILYRDWKPENIRRYNNTQKEEKDRPIPYIVGLSVDGVLQIGWTKVMKPPMNTTEIPPTQIAIEEGMNLDDYRFTEKRRKLQSYQRGQQVENEDPSFVYFANDEMTKFERMQLIDALEVLITPASENARKIDFTWDLLGFNKDHIWLQLSFDNPWDISDDTQYDTLSVTFWGVEYFKSTQGKEVKFGTTLKWPLVRQISPAEMETVESIDSFLQLLTIGSFLFLLPVVLAGSLLPTWMFINALQIVAHMALLKTMMPANAHYFLKRYLDWLRWYDQEIVDWLQLSFDFKDYEMTKGAYHVLLHMGGYSHQFAQNMVIVIAVFLVILLVLFICTIKDLVIRFAQCSGCCNKRMKEKQHSPCCRNFILRFIYEFFLEFCICIFLQLTVVDFEDFSPSIQYLLSVVLVVGLISLIAFVISRFICNGPWIPGFYATESTSTKSLLQVRKRNPEFDADGYLKEHPVPKAKPWGVFFVNFDTSKLCLWRNKHDKIDAEKFSEDKKSSDQDIEADGRETERRLIPKIIVDDNYLQEKTLEKNATQEGSEAAKSQLIHVDDMIIIREGNVDEAAEKSINDNSCKADLENGESFYENSRDVQELCEGGSKIEEEVVPPRETPEHTVETLPQQLTTLREELSPYQTIEDDSRIQEKQGEKITVNLPAESSHSDRSFDQRRGLVDFHKKVLDEQKVSRRRHHEARRRLKFEATIQPSQSYKTLYYGLKVNHERNVAVMHPLMFMLRRVIYALVIVFMDKIMIFGVFIVMGCCLIMLAYALTEWQWKDRVINLQHVVNEGIIYTLCVVLLLYSNYVEEAQMRHLLGFALIGICILFVTFNTVIIIAYSVHLILMYLGRVFIQRRKKKIKGEVIDQIKKLNHSVTADLNLSKESSFGRPKETLEKSFFKPGDTFAGGYTAKAKSERDQQVAKYSSLKENEKNERGCSGEGRMSISLQCIGTNPLGQSANDSSQHVSSQYKSFFKPSEISGKRQLEFNTDKKMAPFLPKYSGTSLLKEMVIADDISSVLSRDDGTCGNLLHQNAPIELSKIEQGGGGAAAILLSSCDRKQIDRKFFSSDLSVENESPPTQVVTGVVGSAVTPSHQRLDYSSSTQQQQDSNPDLVSLKNKLSRENSPPKKEHDRVLAKSIQELIEYQKSLTPEITDTLAGQPSLVQSTAVEKQTTERRVEEDILASQQTQAIITHEQSIQSMETVKCCGDSKNIHESAKTLQQITMTPQVTRQINDLHGDDVGEDEVRRRTICNDSSGRNTESLIKGLPEPEDSYQSAEMSISFNGGTNSQLQEREQERQDAAPLIREQSGNFQPSNGRKGAGTTVSAALDEGTSPKLGVVRGLRPGGLVSDHVQYHAEITSPSPTHLSRRQSQGRASTPQNDSHHPEENKFGQKRVSQTQPLSKMGQHTADGQVVANKDDSSFGADASKQPCHLDYDKAPLSNTNNCRTLEQSNATQQEIPRFGSQVSSNVDKLSVSDQEAYLKIQRRLAEATQIFKERNHGNRGSVDTPLRVQFANLPKPRTVTFDTHQSFPNAAQKSSNQAFNINLLSQQRMNQRSSLPEIRPITTSQYAQPKPQPQTFQPPYLQQPLTQQTDSSMYTETAGDRSLSNNRRDGSIGSNKIENRWDTRKDSRKISHLGLFFPSFSNANQGQLDLQTRSVQQHLKSKGAIKLAKSTKNSIGSVHGEHIYVRPGIFSSKRKEQNLSHNYREHTSNSLIRKKAPNLSVDSEKSIIFEEWKKDPFRGPARDTKFNSSVKVKDSTANRLTRGLILPISREGKNSIVALPGNRSPENIGKRELQQQTYSKDPRFNVDLSMISIQENTTLNEVGGVELGQALTQQLRGNRAGSNAAASFINTAAKPGNDSSNNIDSRAVVASTNRSMNVQSLHTPFLDKHRALKMVKKYQNQHAKNHGNHTTVSAVHQQKNQPTIPAETSLTDFEQLLFVNQKVGQLPDREAAGKGYNHSLSTVSNNNNINNQNNNYTEATFSNVASGCTKGVTTKETYLTNLVSQNSIPRNPSLESSEARDFENRHSTRVVQPCRNRLTPKSTKRHGQSVRKRHINDISPGRWSVDKQQQQQPTSSSVEHDKTLSTTALNMIHIGRVSAANSIERKGQKETSEDRRQRKKDYKF